MIRERPIVHSRSVLATLLLLVGLGAPVAASVPSGFQDTTVASGLSQPAGLAFAPDGRLFVVEKTGDVRIIENGVLLATPFLDVTQVLQPPLTFDDYSERGLLGVAFDPSFPSVPYVYLYYSVCKVPGSGMCALAKNRVARVTAGLQGNPDRADPASHVVLLDDIDSDAGNHNGGWIDFGPLDRKLYVSVGDGGSVHTKSQDMSSLNGKVLRLNSDGTVPFDNPFVGLFQARPEIYALGFRNPWRCRFHPDGRLFCGDVGENSWEEIDWVVAGGNYGWPTTEGTFDPAVYPQFVEPIFVYSHSSVGGSCSITGGDFGSETSFPGDYQQSYFFGDYVVGFIRRVVLAADGVTVQSVTDFASGVGGVTDLLAGPEGALYYPDIIAGEVHRIAATGSNAPPVARATATPQQGGAPLTVQFSSAGSTDADGDPLTVRWSFGDGSPVSTAVAPSHTYTALGAYVVTLTVSDNRTPMPGTDTVTLPITVGTPPVVTITQPVDQSLFQGGQTITMAGTAVDAQDGTLPSSALEWEVRFHHDTHYHPFLSGLTGSPLQFVTQTSGEVSPNVSYEIILRATDSSGLTGETSVYIEPRLSTVTLDTSPPGLQLTLDGQPVTAPAQFTGVVGVVRTIGAASPQGPYTFNRWSDGGVQVHTISTPTSNAAYTAFFNGGTTTTSPPTTTTTSSTTTSSTVRPTTSTSSTSPTTSSSTTTSTTTSTTAPPAGTAWFGNHSVGSQTSVNTADYSRLSPFALGESATVTRLFIYLASPAGGSQRIRPVIYRDTQGRPGALAATGPERSISPATSGEWVALPLATPVSLAPGTYWLGMITGDTSMATVHFVGTSPASKVFIWDAYSNGPAATADPPTVVPGPISVYAEYLSATPTTSTTSTAPPTTSTTSSSTTSTSVTTSTSTTSTTQAPATTSSTTTSSTTTTSTTAPPAGPEWFGNQTVGSLSSVNTTDYERLSAFALGEPGRVTRLVIYLASPAGGSQRIRPVIYRDAGGTPGALAAAGPELLVAPSASGEWVGLPLTTPVSLTPGTYWLGMITGDTSKATVHFVGATPKAKVYIWDAYADGPATPAGAGTVDTGPISIYAEYLP
jgi:glucose/arabinose dehydrogenase